MKDLTEIICVIDRSGSMDSIAKDAIEGFNTFLDSQQKEEGEAKLTMVLFDDEYELIHNAIDIKDVPQLTNKTFVPRGSTALYDAIGRTMNEVGARLANTSEDERPNKVIFVILTDGENNITNNFTRDKIAEMIEHQKIVYSWSFIFLATNVDACLGAKSLNIPSNNAMNFANTEQGTQMAFANISSYMSRTRSMDATMYAASVNNALNDNEKNAE